MSNNIFMLIDLLGTAAFAISGVFAAMEKKLDLFGVYVIAFITAIGGGTIRDVLIGDFPVAWMRTGYYPVTIFIGASVALFFHKLRNYQKVLLLFDSIGLGFFTVLGIRKGIALDFSMGLCIALGTITACFGGLIRDVLLNQIPQILHKEIYATACIAGGILFFTLQKISLPPVALDGICILAIVTVRLIAVKYNWSLPGIYPTNKKE